MTKEYFVKLVSSVILPLFIGAQIVGEEPSSSRDSEVAQGTSGAMLLKAQKQDEYRLVIKRNQPFKNNDIVFVKQVLTELMLVHSYNIIEPAYLKKLQSLAIEKAICLSLSENSHDTLLELISELGKWSERTYEGRNLSFGFVINETVDTKNHNLHFSNLVDADFIALLSDGKKSTLELDKNGFLMGHSIFDRQRVIPTICPEEHIPFAKFCGDKRIGLTLFENGDMLLFKNHSMLFAKRRGIWNSYDHETLIDLLSNKSTHSLKEIRRSIYFTALDVSFEKKGGCIVYLNKDSINTVLNHIDLDDIIVEEYFEKKKLLEKEESEKLYNIFNKVVDKDVLNMSFEDYLVAHNCVKSLSLKNIISGRKFHQLPRKLREELVSMDGATVVDYDGTIVAVGAIIKIEAGSTGGGRLAATKTLSRYGVALKISTDGIIQGFVFDKRQNKAKPIFSLG